MVLRREGGTYNTRPPLVVPTIFDHQVCSFLILVHPSLSIRLPRWHSSHTVQGSVLLQSINNLLLRRGSQRLGIRPSNSFERAILVTPVSRQGDRVEGPFMMVCSASYVELIDAVGTVMLLFAEMGGTMSELLFSS